MIRLTNQQKTYITAQAACLKLPAQKRRYQMTDETIIDRNGKLKRVLRPKDGNLLNILQDGERLRVSLMDAMAARDEQLSDADRYVLADQEWREKTRANRAGFRYDISDAGRQRRQRVRDAYDEVNAANAEAWRSLGGENTKFRGEAGTGQRGSREGDICSINGAAGHLRYGEDGELYCRADGIEDLDKNSPEEAISDARANSYADYDAYISNCYKTLR